MVGQRKLLKILVLSKEKNFDLKKPKRRKEITREEP